ncbi:MAG: hypothetical protein ACREQA_23805 [Candidatus Binatia bacterium]
MNVAVLSESPADEAAVRILIGGILGSSTQVVSYPPLRMRGWPSILQLLPSVLKHLHYQTDTEALALVIDSNNSPVHDPTHEEVGRAEEDCRICKLRKVVSQTHRQLRPVQGRQPVKTAIGLAVPSIEAWYRCGVDGRVTEAAWILGMQSGSFPYTKNGLKRDVYKTERPSLSLEEKRAVEEANRLVHNLELLENLFPNGFGTLAKDVRSW